MKRRCARLARNVRRWTCGTGSSPPRRCSCASRPRACRRGRWPRRLDVALGSLSSCSSPLSCAALLAGGDDPSTAVLVVLVLVSTTLAFFVYPAVAEARFGTTLGKAACGLRVVTVEGGPVRARHATIRSALQLVDLVLIPIGVIAVLSSLASPLDQRLGDRIAGTLVLRARSGAADALALAFPPLPGYEGYVASLDVSAVTGEQYEVLRSFLTRVGELQPDARFHLADTPRPAARRGHGARAPAAPAPRAVLRLRRRRLPAAPRRPAVGMSDVTYLDHAATSPLRPEVFEAMADGVGRGPRQPVGRAPAGPRRPAASSTTPATRSPPCSAAQPGDVVFTSGGTEADNLAVLGLAEGAGSAVCPAAEHHAVLARRRVDAGHGRRRSTALGRVDLDALADALHDGVQVVSVMLANNEVGTVNDLAAVAAVVAERAPAAALHTDAVQAARWLDVADARPPRATWCRSPPTSSAARSAPARSSCAAAPDRSRPRLIGGGQERDRRSGTQDVAGAVGLATALRLAADERAEVVARVGRLRDRLPTGCAPRCPGWSRPRSARTAPAATSSPAPATCACPASRPRRVLFLLDEAGVCASAASSCASGAQQASHVLGGHGRALRASPAARCGSRSARRRPTPTSTAPSRVVPAAVEQVRAS